MTQERVVELKEQAYQVESQTPQMTDEMVEDGRRLLGVDLRNQRSTQTITLDAIRDYCNYNGSTNPLFLDEDYARKTRWGGIIAPPSIVGSRIIAPGMRAIQWIYAGTDWEFFAPIRPGDTLTSRGRLIAAEEKHGRTVPRMVLQTGESRVWNQNGELVAIVHGHTMRTPRSRASGGMSYKARFQAWTDEQIREMEDAIDTEVVRGANPRYWEEIEVGEEMKPVYYGPLRTIEIAFTGGSGTGEGGGAHVYHILARRRHPANSYINPVTSAQDDPHRGHWEEHMAQEVGMPGIYDLGPHRLSWLDRYVTDWMGDDAFLKKLGGRLRRPNVAGDLTVIKGKVVKKWQEGEAHYVECEIWAQNQVEEVSMPGRAVVELPGKTRWV